ncbi:uncharacterized protein LOC111642811 [Copidosoma floridanum]|uniref:uncharacterized protein LOC111642811 n=1 Tax=Copidosoma floridanum TaxID=29053 RepID=UPI000C6FB753|nr:uncharacterized protein LOC111642811 [Copidosoma floridanum]
MSMDDCNDGPSGLEGSGVKLTVLFGQAVYAGNQITSSSNISRKLDVELSAHSSSKFNAKDVKKIDCTEFIIDSVNVVVTDRSITVTGIKKNEQDDSVNAFLQLIIKYNIPDECDLNSIKARLCSDEVLCIWIPVKNE